ncbi:MAG: hypothetical protein PHQ43_06655 [Dehalococcoidales bacterium]|nr:hypothetical protein [Dehalococcoidales bacterium]
MTVLIQAPSVILPTLAPLSTETETVDDLVVHTSLEFPVEYLQEKEIHIIATEVVVAGVPGALNCWVELSPIPSANNLMWPFPLPAAATYWAAFGGGGGAMVPVAPLVEAATGVTATVHSILIPWAIHSAWARLVIQTPVSATPATAFWIVQAVFSGASK